MGGAWQGPGALQGCAEGGLALGALRVMHGVGTGRGLVAVACTGEGRLVACVCWVLGVQEGAEGWEKWCGSAAKPFCTKKEFLSFLKLLFNSERLGSSL